MCLNPTAQNISHGATILQTFIWENTRGGNYHICRYGMCHFWGAFFRAENKFWGIIFGKITSSHKFWGVILEK